MTQLFTKEEENDMKKILLTTALLSLPALAWGGDEAPTSISNAEAISLIQDHANYLWTLIAAALVFLCRPGLPW